MERNSCKVETGVQLLTRLSTKKANFKNFYPYLFDSVPRAGEVIEIYSNKSSSFLVIDMICEALIPLNFGGAETGVLILKTDGHISVEGLATCLLEKLKSLANLSTDEEYIKILKNLMNNLYILDIFDATQFCTTLQNLENLLLKFNNISLCVIDTLTAFYWSEQSYKITKMDSYLKGILKMVQKAVKGSKMTIIYTRPEYFNSSKDFLENLESCCENPTMERVNLRIQLMVNEDDSCTAKVKHFNGQTVKHFRKVNTKIVWL